MKVVTQSSDVGQLVSYMLTTVDNPFNPLTEWREWFAWDYNAGYHTPGLLARIAKTSDELSEADQDQAILWAMDEIVRENVSGMHKKIAVTGEMSANS